MSTTISTIKCPLLLFQQYQLESFNTQNSVMKIPHYLVVIWELWRKSLFGHPSIHSKQVELSGYQVSQRSSASCWPVHVLALLSASDKTVPSNELESKKRTEVSIRSAASSNSKGLIQTTHKTSYDLITTSFNYSLLSLNRPQTMVGRNLLLHLMPRKSTHISCSISRKTGGKIGRFLLGERVAHPILPPKAKWQLLPPAPLLHPHHFHCHTMPLSTHFHHWKTLALPKLGGSQAFHKALLLGFSSRGQESQAIMPCATTPPSHHWGGHSSSGRSNGNDCWEECGEEKMPWCICNRITGCLHRPQMQQNTSIPYRFLQPQ